MKLASTTKDLDMLSLDYQREYYKFLPLTPDTKQYQQHGTDWLYALESLKRTTLINLGDFVSAAQTTPKKMPKRFPILSKQVTNFGENAEAALEVSLLNAQLENALTIEAPINALNFVDVLKVGLSYIAAKNLPQTKIYRVNQQIAFVSKEQPGFGYNPYAIVELPNNRSHMVFTAGLQQFPIAR